MNRTWHIEAHQFRIEVFANEVGKPTPEGIHRDGVAFGMVMMIDRTNVLNGETTIYRNGYDVPVGQHTLLQPLDCLLFEDQNVRHAVSSITVENRARRGTRDLPGRGKIGIFNRSYYEEVLIVRVHPEIFRSEGLPDALLDEKKVWHDLYRSIVDLEKHLHANGTRIVQIPS